MLKVLTQLCEQNQFVSLYTNVDKISKFFFGKVLCVNSEHIAIYLLSPDGRFDGILVRRTDEVIRVEVDGLYSEKMKKLYSLYELKAFEYPLDEERISESLLKIAVETKKIVSLEMMKSGYNDIVGFVEHVEDGVCRVKQVDEYGFEDGYSFVEIGKLSQISYASQEEETIRRLWELSK